MANSETMKKLYSLYTQNLDNHTITNYNANKVIKISDSGYVFEDGVAWSLTKALNEAEPTSVYVSTKMLVNTKRIHPMVEATLQKQYGIDILLVPRSELNAMSPETTVAEDLIHYTSYQVKYSGTSHKYDFTMNVEFGQRRFDADDKDLGEYRDSGMNKTIAEYTVYIFAGQTVLILPTETFKNLTSDVPTRPVGDYLEKDKDNNHWRSMCAQVKILPLLTHPEASIIALPQRWRTLNKKIDCASYYDIKMCPKEGATINRNKLPWYLRGQDWDLETYIRVGKHSFADVVGTDELMSELINDNNLNGEY